MGGFRLRIAPKSKPGRTLGLRFRLRTPQKSKQVGGVRLRIAPQGRPGMTLGSRFRLRTPQKSKQVRGVRLRIALEGQAGGKGQVVYRAKEKARWDLRV